ncbi:PREDICTED: epidermal growth factor receptor isoform X1 [Drosophila arizonae]|uniref:Receptor protein-tyrosine kinase n=1 Tax=Drosophila arizonae TaxID=7263 RepID=A0ABM1PEA4_DROAR|nr:PREDICTED: epidermal growth factor receptor isoform X1 [Drosophila arizonae]
MRIFKLFRRRGSSFYLPLLLLLLVHCICMWPVLAARDRYARQNSKQRHQDAYRSNASRARNRGGGSGNHERAAAAAAAASSAALIASGSSIGDNNKDTFPKGKICIGTKSRLSVPSNREHHYRNLRDRYTNCTYVDGNLELTWLQDPNLDLSFLANIREVTGYILISHVDVTNVIFPKLQIIRGRTLFSLTVEEEKYALFATYSKMNTLEMPELRDILAGWVGFFNNYNLCHTRSIVWREILSGANDDYNYTYTFTAAERTCPACHPSCERGACWGEGAHNCQKFSKITCAPQCAQGRCFGSGPRDCCHLFCAGGCTGPTQKDCIACKNFFDDGVCKEECPPMRKYNPTNYELEANPEGKYAYGATCVRECPGHLLKDNGACVRSCPSDKMAKDGECVACNGPCPKTCPGIAVLHSGNIDSFKNCTVIEGNIRVLDQTFSGYQDIYANYTMGARYIPMHPDRLEVFSTVKEITGYLNIEGVHPQFKNLSYFRNLEVIHGRQLMESYFAALAIVKSSLSSLELRSLKRINSGSIVIQHNTQLCYVSSIHWAAIQKTNDQKLFINENLNTSECRKTGQICSDQCNSDGCWGAGPEQCLNCKSFNYNGTCIADCRNVSNTYQFDSKTCKKCHPECRTCSGPGAEHCDECVHVRDEQHCVTVCPDDKYADFGICRKCHETCEGCTGPKNTIGHGACNTCNLAIINADATVERCLRKDDKCPDGYYWEYVHPQEQGSLKPLAGKAICRKCHPRCELCTNYGFHLQVCSKCARYKRLEQCEDECPSDHYADEERRECFVCHPECKGCTGPGAEDCLACVNFKVFAEGEVYDNSTMFNCTSKCPAEQPHVNYQSHFIGPHCVSSPPRGSKVTANLNVNMIIIIFVAVFIPVLCVLCVIIYICRQKQQEKKETDDLAKVFFGCDDAEPLRPSNMGANLSKLRIVKDAELRKGGVLGMGAFGRVYKGVWVPEGENVKIPVAIKELLKTSGAESSQEFLNEAYAMATVEHGNLLKLLAVCMSSQMMLITQLMPLGCLLDYVRNNRDKIGSKALLNWSTQIAKGMSYLEERRLVHRDLAARNVLVQTPSLVKITDFGLAKLLSLESNEYKAAGGKMPIKWLALECIRHRIFSSKSDVWAFGVTIWELLTFGQRPHENILAKDIPDLIEMGLKLEQPEICSLDIYCTLLSCWQLDADLRPTFKQLTNVFAEFARDPGRFLVIPGDKFTRLPAYTSQDEKDLIRKLAPTTDGSEPLVEADDYLQPKAAPGPSHRTDGTDEIPKLNRYCKDPSNKNSNSGGGVGDDETDSNAREVGVGNLRLDLPVDEDDYLMPTGQSNGSSNNNNNSNNPNNNMAAAATGYIDVIGVPVSVDNPEYLLNALSAGEAPIPTQTIGIPVAGVPGSMEVKMPGSESTSSDHEYYNDTQRELQPLQLLRSRSTETRV